MSMLDGLKSKPERVKSNIALVGAIVCTASVGAVWTSTLPVRFAALGESLQVGIENTATAKNALTDLVTEVEETSAPEDVPTITEDSLQPSLMRESALEKLAEERFEPTAATATKRDAEVVVTPPPVVVATTTPPVRTPVEPALVTETETLAPKPRTILIGTTTKPTP
jgi:hypothetical protein